MQKKCCQMPAPSTPLPGLSQVRGCQGPAGLGDRFSGVLPPTGKPWRRAGGLNTGSRSPGLGGGLFPRLQAMPAFLLLPSTPTE